MDSGSRFTNILQHPLGLEIERQRGAKMPRRVAGLLLMAGGMVVEL